MNTIIDKKVITAQQLYFLCLLFRLSGVKAKNLELYQCKTGSIQTLIDKDTFTFTVAENGTGFELIDARDNLWFKTETLAENESQYTGLLELEEELTDKEVHLIDLSVKAYRDNSEE